MAYEPSPRHEGHCPTCITKFCLPLLFDMNSLLMSSLPGDHPSEGDYEWTF